MHNDSKPRVYNSPPPFWFLIRRAFPSASLEHQIFAFYPAIYSSVPVSADLMEHEGTHLKQQGSKLGALVWWFRYWYSPGFRYRMEVEACTAQYHKAQTMASREHVKALLEKMADNLSSSVYNNCVTREQAYRDLANATYD